MNFTDLRLRIGRFFRNNRKILGILFLIWLVVFVINLMLKNKEPSMVPETSYEPHASVMDSTSIVPEKMQVEYEDLIAKYIGHCNANEFDVAFQMLSEECRFEAFNNDIKEFMEYLVKMMPDKKEYAIQNYSNGMINGKQTYVYQVKYYDDVLSSGLTGQEYSFTEEKIAFTEGKYGFPEMSVGNFLYHQDVNRVSENEYLKVDVIDKDVYYSMEEYNIKLTNRTDKTIVIADGTEETELSFALTAETRERQEKGNIVLAANQSINIVTSTFKYADDADSIIEVVLPKVRVMEKYSGTENVEDSVIENEKNNALAKFSISVGVY